MNHLRPLVAARGTLRPARPAEMTCLQPWRLNGRVQGGHRLVQVSPCNTVHDRVRPG